jgi:DDB1- and CUL4-associated factor 5
VDIPYSPNQIIKHGSFGGPGLETDDLYAAGSDDFRGYVWKIPPLSVLEEQRKVFSVNEWENYQSDTTEVGELHDLPATLLVNINSLSVY